jgi:hypothetical protein
VKTWAILTRQFSSPVKTTKKVLTGRFSLGTGMKTGSGSQLAGENHPTLQATCKSSRKAVTKNYFHGLQKSKTNADFLDWERDKSKGGMCSGLPPYDEFLGFSGRVGGHSDNQKKKSGFGHACVFHYHRMRRSAQSSGCWCHNFQAYFGFSLSLCLSFSFMGCLYQDVRQTVRTSGSL